MTNYVFTGQNGKPGDAYSFFNKVEFEAEVLDDVIGNFELFLKGAGFTFDGHLDIVNSDYTKHNTFNNDPNADSYND